MTALVPGLIISLQRVALVPSAAHRILSNGTNRFYLHPAFSTSSPLRGLEEFFPPLTDNPTDLVEESEKAGQLRYEKMVSPSLSGRHVYSYYCSYHRYYNRERFSHALMKFLFLLQVVHGRRMSLG